MILIAGIPSESPVEMVINAADKANIPYLVLNQREFHLYDISVQWKDNRFRALIKVNGREYDLEKFKGVYLRMMDYLFLPELRKNKVFNYVGTEAVQKSEFIHQVFTNWLAVTQCRIFNRDADMNSNFSKPYQLQLIAEAGFKVPPSLITSDTGAFNDFEKKYPEIIYKSISGTRSIVNEVGAKEKEILKKIRYLPVQFQKKLSGENIRVHVVGDVLFSTRIISPVIDYRYAHRQGAESQLKAYKLPDIVSEKCFKLSRKLNLPLCGIDLFKTTKGEFYCFEVNPSPAYSYYEANTGQKISEAIARYLETGSAK